MVLPLPPDRGEVPVEGVVPVDCIIGDDEEDTVLLRDMASFGDTYVRSFSWCGAVSKSYFGGGIGGIFAIFLLDIKPTRSGIGRWIWVIVGDVPPAYLPIEDAKAPQKC